MKRSNTVGIGSPSSNVPALKSIQLDFFSANPVWDEIFTVGTNVPKGVPRPVVNSTIWHPEAAKAVPVSYTHLLLLVVLPWLYASWHPGFIYDFQAWLYRTLVFLVISCPCALVVSIPLGYFGGIGAASRRGILFKGSLCCVIADTPTFQSSLLTSFM